MVQHIVAGLMPEDEEHLVGRSLLDGGVPYDDALGAAEAGDIGVERGDLLAGLHQVHALGRDIHVALLYDLLQLRDQLRIGLLQRLKLVEERINHIGSDEDADQHERYGESPGEQPPLTRSLADAPGEQHQQQAADDPDQCECLGLVTEPASPGLYGEAILQLHVLVVEVERQADQRANQEIEEEEDVALHPTIGADLHGSVPHPGNDAEGQQQDKADDAPGLFHKVHGDADRAQVLGFRKVRWRERIIGHIAVYGRGVHLILGVHVGGVLGGGLPGTARKRHGEQKAQQEGKPAQGHRRPSEQLE